MPIGRFVRGLALISLLTLGVAADGPALRPDFLVGHLDNKDLDELSGLAASRKYPGVYWGHNDSGNPAELWALTRQGHVLARVPVKDAPNVDWEDIAIDDQHDQLYVSDMGNNNRTRTRGYIYRFDEPDPAKPAAIHPTAKWTILYHDKPFDCESLFVWRGWGYVMPKLRSFGSPMLYRFPLTETDQPVTLQPVEELSAVHGPVTGADISTDGKWMAVLTVLGPYVFEIDGDPLKSLKAKPTGHAVFVAIKEESICFVKDGLLVGTEEGDLFVFNWAQLGMKAPW